MKISAARPDNRMGLCGRALVLMRLAVAGREHELACNRVRDYADTPAGVQADLRVSKIRPRASCPSPTAPVHRSARSVPGRPGRTADLTDPNGYAWRRMHPRWHTVMDSGL
ncbi:hypothetical protein [Streptomyces sp. NPDC058268]|uniref:hypothetical protein n=1 Tax=Streptomyces sp. NPDC058268 TaxID=3346413 RepID=UPI0036EABDF0